MTHTLPAKPTPEHERILHDNVVRLRTKEGARLVWERCLNTAERTHFGNDFDTKYSVSRHFLLNFWMSKNQFSAVRTVIDLAQRVDLLSDSNARWVLREYGEMFETLEEALTFALAKYRLVLVNDPPSVYWHGQLADVDWAKHAAIWNFIDELVRHAKRGCTLHADELNSDCARNYLATQKNRLKNQLPKTGFAVPLDLKDLIKPAGRNAYRLNLDKNRICILDVDEHGSVCVTG